MTTAWEQAYLALRRCLADGTYPPGAHLREEDLATQLGVSRTPLREALRRLDAEGWLRVVPNQGAFAAEWSLPEMVEIPARHVGSPCGRTCGHGAKPPGNRSAARGL